jgi:hypothetical protein
LLDAAGRRDFATWLLEQQKVLKLSQTRIGKRLGGNPGQWRSYIDGTTFPRTDGCVAIAKALGLPKPGLLFRAGYLGSLVGALPELVRLGRLQCESNRLRFDASLGGSLVKGGTDRPGFLAYQTNEKDYSLLVPYEISDALYLAVVAFPRRGDLYNNEDDTYETELWERIESALDKAKFEYVRSGRLPFPLDLASQVLGDSRLPPRIKKAVAGELTQFWANTTSPYAAAWIRRHVYALFADKLGGVSPISGHGLPLSSILERLISGTPIIQPIIKENS